MRVLGRSLPTLAVALLLTAGLPRAAAGDVLTFAPTADTYVDADAPNGNFDADTRLRADAAPERVIYLRFAVAGTGSRPVQDARLRLVVSGAASSGGTVHAITNTTWDPRTVTFATRPPVDGPALHTLGAVAVGATVEFNVGAAVTGDGVYNFAIESSKDDGVSYQPATATSALRPALVVTVAAAPLPEPTVRILQPPPEASFLVGDAVTLQGTATDAADGDLGAALRWTSSLDGPLGTGPLLTPSLTAGTHTLTAAVTDRDGFTGTARVTVTVQPNTPPLVTITAPATGATLPAPVALAATARDPEDGSLTAALAWSSDLQGPLGTGSPRTAALVPGTHRLTARVTDRGGLTGSATVTVTVPLDVPAVADAYVLSGSSANYGSDTTLKVDASTLHIGYLRFVVAGAGAANVTRAVLRLRVDTASSAGSDSGGTFHTLSNTTWDERTVTWATRPAIDGPTLATLGPVALGAVVDVDVTAAVTGDGVYSFAITSASADGVSYRTREGGVPPRLLLTLRAPAPTIAITAPAAGTTVTVGTPVTLRGSATDMVDGNLAGALRWTSSLDGALGTGASVTAGGLRIGTHAVAAEVRNSAGVSVRAAITLRVRAPNAAPNVSITAPPGGTSVPAGTAVSLAASALDDFDGDLASRVKWKSSRDGTLGTGSPRTVFPSEGVHTIAATVTDSDGAIASTTVSLTVLPTPPVVTITAPGSGAIIAGTAVTFNASAHDVTDGTLTAGIHWASHRDGPLGTGGTVTATLRAGPHVVTATVSDRGGLAGTATVSLTVHVPGQFGFEAFSFGDGVDQDNNRATASKPESKLWYVDGIWWATLYSLAGSAHRIHAYDPVMESWIDTGVVVDERALSRQDALWDGTKLYMVSRFAGPPGQNRVLRYSYHPDTVRWSLDAGFPVDVPGGGTESATIAKDSTGMLWITYTLGRTVFVSHTTGSDTQWAAPFAVPIGSAGTGLASDDIAAVVALNGSIGVFWSHQPKETDYFAVHTDGRTPTDPAAWHLEIAAAGDRVADDHFNLKVAPDGRLFAAVKTSRTGDSDTLVGLLVRSAAGSWSPLHTVTVGEFSPTRPQCLIDPVARRVYVFYSKNTSGIHYKVSDTDTIAFPTGKGTPLIDSPEITDINNPTTTKQTVSAESGIVIVAASPMANSYWYNTLDIP
jgi:hypothetical protein